MSCPSISNLPWPRITLNISCNYKITGAGIYFGPEEIKQNNWGLMVTVGKEIRSGGLLGGNTMILKRLNTDEPDFARLNEMKSQMLKLLEDEDSSTLTMEVI